MAWKAGEGKYKLSSLTQEEIEGLLAGSIGVGSTLKPLTSDAELYVIDAVDINWKGIKVDGVEYASTGELIAALSGSAGNIGLKYYPATPAVEAVKFTQEEIDAAVEGDAAFGKTTDDIKTEAVEASNAKIALISGEEDNETIISEIDATDFIKDGILSNVEYIQTAEADLDENIKTGDPYLTFVWNVDAADKVINIPLKDFIDITNIAGDEYVSAEIGEDTKEITITTNVVKLADATEGSVEVSHDATQEDVDAGLAENVGDKVIDTEAVAKTNGLVDALDVKEYVEDITSTGSVVYTEETYYTEEDLETQGEDATKAIGDVKVARNLTFDATDGTLLDGDQAISKIKEYIDSIALIWDED